MHDVVRGDGGDVTAEDLRLAAEVARTGRAAVRTTPAGADRLRCRLFSPRPVRLSEIVPMLERLGVDVDDERAWRIESDEAPPVHLSDLGVCATGGSIADDAVGRWASAVEAVWSGDAIDDGMNRLILPAGLDVRRVHVLRTYVRWIRQGPLPFGLGSLERALAAHPALARLLVELFEARLDPARDTGRDDAVAAVRAELRHGLDAVVSLDEDRVIRAVAEAVEATVRTNAWRDDDPIGTGAERTTLAVKLDPSRITGLPAPRPFREIWVCGPRVDGVHLRGGPVARGGLRWSDRRDDLRTEILGLMKAQMAKNAVIVPVGAKGGFVLLRPPSDPSARRAEVVACYRQFVGALLDVTDNLDLSGAPGTARVVTPPGVVRHDGDDPYLVVAADKGTASFSDLANEVAAAYGFWLGDAFASGGRHGYDHKAMGITARGAWESVRRHCRHLGIDADTAALRVVGIGDMSGDVFGNGLLRSPHLRLVAAFDHRHVFLDPDPDPAASYAERRRLFERTGSSWADYDPAVMSTGGGVWPRDAKAVPLSAPARQVLGIDDEVLTPAELVRAILRAPVDLLWNGGIGTFVKATAESDESVGDRANDAVRVNGADLRCRMIAEGGNLGVTARGRIEYALAGGLVHTDAIDNSAGVDCSDHEVNLKILLDAAVAAGDLDRSRRNELLAAMTDAVAASVLEDNRAQTLALAIARAQAGPMVDVHRRLLADLVADGTVDRTLDALPGERELRERARDGRGLTTPEFSVLLSAVKVAARAEILASDLADDPAVTDRLTTSFPAAAVDAAGRHLASHRLRREIVATRIVNDLVNRMGVSFLFRMEDETGAGVADIVRAHESVSRVLDLPGRWATVADTATAADPIEHLLRLRRLAERSTRWLLRRFRPPLDIAAVVVGFAEPLARLAEVLPGVLAASGIDDADGLAHLHTGFDATVLARARARDVVEVATVTWSLVQYLELGWLLDAVGALPRAERWDDLARAGLRDDLAAALHALTDAALRAGDAFDPPAVLVERWAAAAARPIERCRHTHTQLRATAGNDLVRLTVAVRELRLLAAVG